MRTVLRIALWNLAFIVVLVASLAVAASLRLDLLAFGLPAVIAVWVLILGARFAHRRWAVVTCAVAGVLLLLFQIALFAFFAWWNRGFGNTRGWTESLVMVLYVAVGGAVVVGWYLVAKLRRPAG